MGNDNNDDNQQQANEETRQPVDAAGGVRGWISWARNTAAYPGAGRTAFTEHRYNPHQDKTPDDYDPWAGH